MKGFSNDSVKQFYFLAVLTILAGILGYMLRDYISSFLGAATLYIVFRQPLHYLTEQRRWHKALAVSALIVVSMIVVLIPVGLLSFMLSSKAQYLVEHYAEFLDIVKGWNERLSAGYGVNLISQESISKVTAAGADFIPVLLSATLSSFTQIAVLYFLLYFMMMEGRSMERLVLQYSPFNNDNTLILLRELRIQTMSNVIGIPVLIVIQAGIAWIGFWIFGMDQPFFWGVITGFASMIPIIGAAVVWIPVCIYMYISGKPGGSIGAAIYNGLLLVNVEHLVRFSMLKKFGNTHPLVTFFGLVIGIELFGFLGLIFGPLLISYFMILLQIYRREYIDDTPEIILQPLTAPAPEVVIQAPPAPDKDENV